MKRLVRVILATASMMTMMHADATTKSQKDIMVVSASETNNDGEISYNTKRGSLFRFVKPSKNSVAVGEPITMSIKLKKKAYVYFIAVSSSNKAYMILPNRIKGYNRYRANKTYTIPKRKGKFHFVSDRPGVETIYVIATTYKQSFDQLLNQFGKDEVGGFRISSNKSAQTYMKDILVVPARANKAKVEVRKFKINITDRDGRIVSSEPDTHVFLSSGKTNYKLGDIVTIKYQADDEGYVHLAAVNPDGSADLIKSRFVKKNKSYTLKQKIVGDKGEYTLLAFFSSKALKNPEKALDFDNINRKGGQNKALVAVPTNEYNAKNQHTIMVK